MSNFPSSDEQWAQEAIETLILAMKLVEQELKEPLNEQSKQELYKYAPVLAAFNRKIDDKSTVSEMAHYAFGQRLEDQQVGQLKSGGGELNFFLAYLESHVPLNAIEEKDIQPIMEVVIKKLAA